MGERDRLGIGLDGKGVLRHHEAPLAPTRAILAEDAGGDAASAIQRIERRDLRETRFLIAFPPGRLHGGFIILRAAGNELPRVHVRAVQDADPQPVGGHGKGNDQNLHR